MYKKQARLFKRDYMINGHRLMAMKMRLKMKNRLHGYAINRPTPRYGHKCTKYIMCLIIVMIICFKQHLSNI